MIIYNIRLFHPHAEKADAGLLSFLLPVYFQRTVRIPPHTAAEYACLYCADRNGCRNHLHALLNYQLQEGHSADRKEYLRHRPLQSAGHYPQPEYRGLLFARSCSFFQNTMEKGIFHDRLKCDLWYGILQDNRINIGKKTDFARKTKILYFHVIGYMTDFITYRNNIFSLVQGQLVKIGERIYDRTDLFRFF